MSTFCKRITKLRNFIIFIAIAIICFFLVWLLHSQAAITRDIDVGSGGITAGEIIGENTVEQTFSSTKNGLCSVELLLATYARTNTCNVNISIADLTDNVTIYSTAVSAEDIQDNSYYVVNFDPVSNSSGHSYKISIYSDNSESGNAITAWCSDTDIYSDGELYIAGNPTGGDMGFRVSYDSSVYYLSAIIISAVLFTAAAVVVKLARAFAKTIALKWVAMAVAALMAAVSVYVTYNAAVFKDPFISLSKDFIVASTVLAVPICFVFWLYMNREKVHEKYFCGKDYAHTTEHKNRLSKLYLIISFCFGIMIIYINPPLACPDEAYHYSYTARISRLDILPDVKDGNTGIYVTADEISFILYDYNADTYSYGKTQEYRDAQDNEDNLEFHPEFGAGSPVGYLISGGTAAVVRLIKGDLSPYDIFIIGKMANLLFSLILISFAIRKSTRLNNTMFLLALMPMTLYQCASLSYDAVVIPCAFLLFAYATRIMDSGEDFKVGKEEIFMICLSTFFLIGAKSAAYSPLIIILLALSIKKFKNLKQYFTCIGLVALMGFISYVIPKIGIEIATSTAVVAENTLKSEQIQYLLSNVFSIPDIISNTVDGNLLFWWEGFIGYFGWFDVRLPKVVLDFYTIVIAISFLTETCIILKTSIRYRALAFISTQIVMLGIMFEMYISWNTTLYGESAIGMDGISGMQGRYFIPVEIFILSIFANRKLCNFKHIDSVIHCENIIIYITTIASLAVTAFTLFTKYWIPTVS